MEFRFKADQDKYFSGMSNNGYFTEQALRGYINNDIRRTEIVRNPVNVREAIQLNLEKERIREEILNAELLRKRVLEAEVRRELRMERELALQRLEGFSLVASSSSMARSKPTIPLICHPDGGRIDERLSFPTGTEVHIRQPDGSRLDERFSLLPHSEVGVFKKLPFQCNPEATVVDVKPLPEVSKGQPLFFTKPVNPNPAGLKRKAVEPAVEGAGLPIVISKKKPQEWSCALCQVSATSEQGLNDHLRGKKHKSKEAILRASTTISNNSTSSSTKTCKPTEKEEGKKLHIRKDGEAPLPKKQKTKVSKKKSGVAPLQKKQKTEASRENFKMWCEICKVGTHCQIVMAAHEGGKKHMARLQQLKKATEAFPENVDGEVDGVEDIYGEEANEAIDTTQAVELAETEATEEPEAESSEVKANDSSVAAESSETLIIDGSRPSSGAE